VGTTIFPYKGDPLTMKVAKIRGVESYGMICAEDEIGLNDNHAGILVLPDSVKIGEAASEYFKPQEDEVFEIGLTPNRMDAMSHLGVARDVCAYLTYHDKADYRVKSPYSDNFKAGSNKIPVAVSIENKNACQRYSGVSITNVSVKESPLWLKQKLKAIGQRPINNIVDITNFILHETGQPLHAFDADAIAGKKIIVKNLPEGTPFISLDEKERKLSADDLIICDGEGKGMCIAGVYGGFGSGVTNKTKSIFLESAWFNPLDIRKTSFRHALRTDAAARFEKNTDISNTVNVLKRAALMIAEITGGEIASEIIDLYPAPQPKTQVKLDFSYLKKLSGKNYPADAVKKILTGLGFELLNEDIAYIQVAVPYSKPDISLPADIVEEIMRIDGLDNIEIPTSITISPSVEEFGYKHVWKEKNANYLAGLGFNEIFTNSITNSAYFSKEDLEHTVKLLNNLSAEHNIMRPSMLETGLESVAHNLNRKNHNLRFFEFGKTYSSQAPGKYDETDHLCLYITGQVTESSWKTKGETADLYYVKGVVNSLMNLMGLRNNEWSSLKNAKLEYGLQIDSVDGLLAELGSVHPAELKHFDIRQPVFMPI
jgi:phenylalanyl-tRNA synthetase beta chain